MTELKNRKDTIEHIRCKKKHTKKIVSGSQWSSVVRPHTPQVYASHSLQSRTLLDDYKMQLLESGTIKICISVDTKVLK